ncbi:MAG: hypothetical protein WCR55_11670 [Lentisphaerota bacterium]
MPFFIKIYIAIFMLLLVSNIIFHSKFKMKILFLIYEIFSALYMMTLIIIYFDPLLLEKLNIISIIPLILIIGVDIYFTTIGSIKELGLNLPDIPEKSQEMAKIISILFNAPAYVIGIMASLEILKNNHIL